MVKTLITFIYFIFYSFWGLNYFRTSISEKLNIKDDYKFEELDKTLDNIISKINEEVLIIEDFNDLAEDIDNALDQI